MRNFRVRLYVLAPGQIEICETTVQASGAEHAAALARPILGESRDGFRIRQSESFTLVFANGDYLESRLA